MHVQPVLLEVASLVFNPEYTNKAGFMAREWWKDYIDAMANKGQMSNVRSNRILAKARINLSRAILGYKLSSIIMQPMAIFDAMSYTYMRFGTAATSRLLAHFAATWLNPRYAKHVVIQSKALQIRKGGELAIEEIQKASRGKGLFNAYQNSSMGLLQWADIKTAAAVDQSMYKILLSQGLSKEDARAEADLLMQLVSGSSDIADRPMILMRGEGSRLWFTFQTFFLNRWGLLYHDLIKTGLVKGKIGVKFRTLMALMILAIGGGVEDDLRKKLFEFITGKKIKEKFTFLQSALLSIPEMIPVLGNVIQSQFEYGQGYSVPLTRLFENITQSFSMIRSEKADTRKRGYLKLTESIGTLFGIAGTAQGFDLIERTIPETKKKQPPTLLPPLPELPEMPKLPELPALPKLF